MHRSFYLVAVVAAASLHAETSRAQPNAVDNELERINGHWRVIEMVEDGRAIPQERMREWLPGGGVLEIIDYTILFKSPLDGSKSTKSFRLDPTSYPKQLAILDRDAVTGTGIYKFDQGKLVICITTNEGSVPTEFSAPEGSKRTMFVMERFEPGKSEIPGMNVRLPPRRPVQSTNQVEQTANRIPQVQPPPPTPVAAQPTPPTPIVAGTAAGRILTDTEVHNLAIGTWRINDGEGSIDIVLNQNGVFRTFRYLQTVSNFHVVFVPTPVSAGNWSVTGGRLIMDVTSSTRVDRLNQSFTPAVRSISATDMILVDHLGRVSRAVKIP